MRRLLSFCLMALCGVLGGALYQAVASNMTVHYPGSHYFGDVLTTSPHDQDIGYLYEMGVTKGYPGGLYGPSITVTRDQMASFQGRIFIASSLISMLVIDYNYFDGYYYGQAAYEAGRITLEAYQGYVDMYNWWYGMAEYEAVVMDSASASSGHGLAATIAPLRDMRPRRQTR